MSDIPSQPSLWRRATLVASKFFGTASSDRLIGGDEIDWGQYYSGIGSSKWVRWLDKNKSKLLREALSALKPGSCILDIGCGTGGVLRELGTKNGFNLFGIEPDTKLATIATANGLQVVSADFNGVLPFSDKTFDAVIMVDVIEHVRCRLATMSEIRRILTEQGIVILFTPPYDSISWIFGEHLVYFLTGRLHVGHISPFTTESLAWILKTSFTDISIKRFNWGLTLMGTGRVKK